MKTVQQHLRELDRDRLVENYLHYTRNEILDDYHDEESNNYRRTIREIRRDHEEFIGEYVDRLRHLKITPPEDGSRGLLYTFKRIDELSEYKPEPCCEFVRLEELLVRGEDATNYSYELDPQSEIMGFLVSDDEYTQQNICALMTDVMYEASWHGFADEGKEDFVDDLAERIEGVVSGTIETVPVDNIFPDWFKEMKRLEEEHKAEEAAERAEVEDETLDAEAVCSEVLKLVNDYNDRSNKKQMRLIQRRLLLARVVGLIQTRLSVEVFA